MDTVLFSYRWFNRTLQPSNVAVREIYLLILSDGKILSETSLVTFSFKKTLWPIRKSGTSTTPKWNPKKAAVITGCERQLWVL